jgi:hypothetical protein
MKTSLKKIALAVLPLVAFLLIAPSLALAKNKHKHCNRDSYSRYDDNYGYSRNRYDNRLSQNWGNGYYGDRYYGDDYNRRPSRSRYRYNDPYYGSPYGNPSSSYSPSNGALPWLDLLIPRY